MYMSTNEHYPVVIPLIYLLNELNLIKEYIEYIINPTSIHYKINMYIIM